MNTRTVMNSRQMEETTKMNYLLTSYNDHPKPQYTRR